MNHLRKKYIFLNTPKSPNELISKPANFSLPQLHRGSIFLKPHAIWLSFFKCRYYNKMLIEVCRNSGVDLVWTMA